MCVSMELDLEFGQGIVNTEMLKSKKQENNVIMSSMFVRKKKSDKQTASGEHVHISSSPSVSHKT